ncbi:MAG TPA: hypothetical protein VHD84_03125 [Candidatus Saccharimonadales bacterium]|nr:hypothetical protein [Candidatus Saccharimonadales bacterium]
MKKVPFFANTHDDTHCVQAGFRIMLKYFLPERDFSYDQLDKMSQKQAGKGTWWPPILIELQKLGLDVVCIEGFGYKEFYRGGADYVRQLYRSEAADYYLNHSNLMAIRPLIPEFLRKVQVQTRPATFEDLDSLLAGGWLVGINLNAAALNDLGRSDYVGHMVVVFDKQNDGYWLHDPGLKPRPNRHVTRQKLSEAWLWAGAKTADLVAMKKPVKSIKKP